MTDIAVKPKILLVEDDIVFRSCILGTLIQCYEATGVSDAQEAMRVLCTENVDIILLDYDLPNISGIDLLKLLKRSKPSIPIIMLTGHSEADIIIETMKSGACDYLIKSQNDLEISLKLKIKQVLEKTALLNENQTLRKKVESQNSKYEMQGISRQILKLKSEVHRLKGTKAFVLISGDNGTGKELVARALNIQEKNTLRPFIAVNCASIPAALFESEFFGHVKGAFTGANENKIGKFEAANGGDLYLDEIGELPLETQAKLLRVLQEKTITRVGDTRQIHVDFRVIAATNRNLEKEVIIGRFREDLFFRLYQIAISIPPLSERPDDILFLAEYFLNKLLPMAKFSKESEEILLNHEWRGNVRELQNAIERAVVFMKDSSSPIVKPKHLMLASVKINSKNEEFPNDFFPKILEQISQSNLEQVIHWIEKKYFERGLELCDGDNKRFYERVNMSKATFFKKKRILFGSDMYLSGKEQ